MAINTKKKTREQIVNDFISALHNKGSTLEEWAIEKDVKPALVYKVTSGAIKGKRGKSRAIAQEMGIEV